LDIAEQGAVVLLPEVGPGILQLAWEEARAAQDVPSRETPLGEPGKLELQSAVHELAPGRGGGVGEIADCMFVARGCQMTPPGLQGLVDGACRRYGASAVAFVREGQAHRQLSPGGGDHLAPGTE